MKFARLPSVCQRCYHPVTRLARTCPDCGESLQRISLFRVAYILMGSLAVFGLMVFAAVTIYRLWILPE
jgi:hypothetical protein